MMLLLLGDSWHVSVVITCIRSVGQLVSKAELAA